MDNFKKCSKCGEVKLLDCFHKNKSKKDGYRFQCKKCRSEAYKKYRAENAGAMKIAEAKHYAKNREKIKAKNDKYITKHIEKVKEKRVKKKAEMVELLKNSYIKEKIKKQSGVPYEHITQELIETKRLHILIQRKLKDLTK